jgi:hypothetical protein
MYVCASLCVLEHGGRGVAQLDIRDGGGSRYLQVGAGGGLWNRANKADVERGGGMTLLVSLILMLCVAWERLCYG